MIGRERVLVVDNEENLCLLYKEELEEEGYQVQAVTDPATALRIVAEDPPDLAVVDIRMPQMDGIEVMGHMLSCERDLPVILNTAYACYQDDFRAWPAAAYVVKSSDLRDLKAAIRRLIDERRAAERLLAGGRASG